ncbi:MAG: lipopolysaccharide biosynthesis protein [Pseudomonadota bacterium]
MSLARQVISGTGVITVAGGAAKLLSLLTAPILTPLLGPAPYGAAALVGTVMALAAVLALLGIDMAYARFYLQEEESQRVAVERFCWRFAATGAIVIALISAGGWYWLGARWLSEHRSIAVYSVIAIGLSVAVSMMTTRVRLLGDYRRIAAALFVAALVSAAVSIGLAFFWRTDVWVLLFGAIAASITTLFMLGFPSRSFFLKPAHLLLKTKLAVVSLGLAGSVTAPMYWVISSADRWFLSHYGNVAEVGVYTVASSVAMLGLMFNSSLTLTWFPEASRVYGQQGAEALPSLGQLWSRLVAGMAIIWLAVAAAGGDVLRLLAAPAFHPGAQYIPWFAGGVFFYGLASLANTALFLTAKMRFAAYVWTAGALLSVGFNFVLIPHFGALGAAMVQCVSYGLIALGILAFSHHLLPIPIPHFQLGITLVITLSAGIVMAPEWAAHPLWSLMLKFPVGLLVAGIVFRIIAPDWYRRLRIDLFRVVAGRKA